LERIVRPCTKYAATLIDNREIRAHVERAFRAMATGRPRPAALILPRDLMDEPASDDDQAAAESASPPNEELGVYRAMTLLSRARRPILLVGGGALGAIEEVKTLARRLRCPVITTLNGKGLIDERDPMSLGHARSARARVVQPHVDVMLAIG